MHERRKVNDRSVDTPSGERYHSVYNIRFNCMYIGFHHSFVLCYCWAVVFSHTYPRNARQSEVLGSRSIDLASNAGHHWCHMWRWKVQPSRLGLFVCLCTLPDALQGGGCLQESLESLGVTVWSWLYWVPLRLHVLSWRNSLTLCVCPSVYVVVTLSGCWSAVDWVCLHSSLWTTTLWDQTEARCGEAEWGTSLLSQICL